MYKPVCQQGIQNYVDRMDAIVDAVPTTQQVTTPQPAAAQSSDPASAPVEPPLTKDPCFN